MNLVFLGPPGSGKGTQSSILSKNYGYKHFSTGEMFRREISLKSQLGVQVEKLISLGQLVPDNLVYKVVSNQLSLNEEKYIFDGFPRTINQANFFTNTLMKGYNFKVINLKISYDILFTRLVNRRVSSDGKYIYNLITTPPKVPGFCDITKLPLIHRPDDMPDVVKNRIEVFLSETEPLIKYFKELGFLHDVDASLETSIISEKILSIISA